MAKEYLTRPSALLGVTDPWLAFEIDQAVLLVGLHPEPEKKKKPKTLRG